MFFVDAEFITIMLLLSGHNYNGEIDSRDTESVKIDGKIAPQYQNQYDLVILLN